MCLNVGTCMCKKYKEKRCIHGNGDCHLLIVRSVLACMVPVCRVNAYAEKACPMKPHCKCDGKLVITIYGIDICNLCSYVHTFRMVLISQYRNEMKQTNTQRFFSGLCISPGLSLHGGPYHNYTKLWLLEVNWRCCATVFVHLFIRILQAG